MARKLKAQTTRPASRPNRGFRLGEGASLQPYGRQGRRRPLDVAWKFGFQEFQGPKPGTPTSRAAGPPCASTSTSKVATPGTSCLVALTLTLLYARRCRVAGRLVACGSGWRRGSRPYGPNPSMRPLTACLPFEKALRQAGPKVVKQKMMSIS